MKSIKDLIYFDYDKAKSINSQINGGLISEMTRAIEEEGSVNSEIGFDIKVIKAKIGSGDKEKTFKTEKIELFHELLNQVENSLSEKKILKNLNNQFQENDLDIELFLNNLPNLNYIKATGYCSFEDNERFKRIMLNFNDIQRLIHSSALENDPEIKKNKSEINDLKKQLKKNSNHKDLAKLTAIEKNFDKIIEERAEAILLDETFIERIETFLNTFTPNRLNFRLAPLDEYKDFQILSNLKNQYIVNGDFENIIYTYGSRPNIKLTVFGIITSCPAVIDERLDINNDYEGIEKSDLPDEVIFEKAFRNVFSSFENFEKFFFVPSYPKIAISPIAIYREVII
jgi:hypothetical protein